jgi:hypothetical protein
MDRNFTRSIQEILASRPDKNCLKRTSNTAKLVGEMKEAALGQNLGTRRKPRAEFSTEFFRLKEGKFNGYTRAS